MLGKDIRIRRWGRETRNVCFRAQHGHCKHEPSAAVVACTRLRRFTVNHQSVMGLWALLHPPNCWQQMDPRDRIVIYFSGLTNAEPTRPQ